MEQSSILNLDKALELTSCFQNPIIKFDNDCIMLSDYSTSIKMETDIGIEAIFNGKSVLSSIKKMSVIGKPDIKFDNKQMIVSQGRNKFIIPEMELNLSFNDNFTDTVYSNLPETFLYGFNLAAKLAAKNNSTGTLSCVLIDDDKMYATDRKRVVKYTLTEGAGQTFLLDSSVNDLLFKLSPDRFCVKENQVLFESNGVECLIAKVGGSTLNYSELFDMPDMFNVPNKLLDLTPIILSFKENLVLNIGNEMIKVENNSPEEKFTSEDIFISSEIEESLLVNPQFLGNILKNDVDHMGYKENKLFFIGDNIEFILSAMND